MAVLFFSGYFVKKFNRNVRIAIALLALFIGIHNVIPTDYVVNKINFDLAKNGQIKVYDPVYTVINNYYTPSELAPQSQTIYDDSVKTNDISSVDGYFIAIELLKEENKDLITDSQRRLLKQKIKDYDSTASISDWREINIIRLLLDQEIKNATHLK